MCDSKCMQMSWMWKTPSRLHLGAIHLTNCMHCRKESLALQRQNALRAQSRRTWVFAASSRSVRSFSNYLLYSANELVMVVLVCLMQPPAPFVILSFAKGCHSQWLHHPDLTMPHSAIFASSSVVWTPFVLLDRMQPCELLPSPNERT
jgi:hypothetical protein